MFNTSESTIQGLTPEIRWLTGPGHLVKELLEDARKYLAFIMGEEKLTGDVFLGINLLTEEAVILNIGEFFGETAVFQLSDSVPYLEFGPKLQEEIDNG